MADSSPQVLAGRYELRQRIGASSAAEVFLAHDRQLDRAVAVKVLLAELASNPEVVERFRQMAASAATVRDPGIVSVFDSGDDAGRPFLVMEYVDGSNLADTLASGQRISVDRAGVIGEGVATALEAAHRTGVIHGNLTPRDVLIGRDGNVKLTDFGTAVAGLAGLGDAPVTTAIYSAPERLQGGPPDAAGDLYSLGIVLHQAVTGSPPFTGPDALSITRRKLEGRPLPPSTTGAGIPPAFDAIVERLLAPSLARRYSSAGEVAADLRRLRAPVDPTAALPVVRPAATTLPSTPVAPRSHVGWIAAAIAVLVIAAIGIVLLVTKDDKPSGPEVTVPAVVGQPVLAAQRAIERAGLRATTVNQANATIEAGTVFDQSPPGASLAKEGTEVRLSISTGPPPTSSTTSATTSTTTSTSTSTTTTTTVPPTSTSSTP